MVINYKLTNNGHAPEINKKGEWFDLFAEGDDRVQYFVHDRVVLIPLGVIFEMPHGIEAHVVSRSSTPIKKGVFVPNSVGIIDNSYRGDKDVIKFPCLSIDNRPKIIKGGDKIAQVKFVLSQKATLWQKIKWFFTRIKLNQVFVLSNESRGGFGSTDNINKKQ